MMAAVFANLSKKLGGGVVGLTDRANGPLGRTGLACFTESLQGEVLLGLWHLWSINTPGEDSFPFSRAAPLFSFPSTKNIP